MFKRLSIKNWRQFEEVNINFHPHLTILTGANGAGKTTILNLISQSIGWMPQFVSSYGKDKSGILKYFCSLKKKGKLIINKTNIKDSNIEDKLGELEFGDGQISELVLPLEVNSGIYNIIIKNAKKEKGVYITSNRPCFPYRAVKTVPTSIATREQIFKKYNEFNKTFVFDTYRNANDISATALIKETLASLAIFGYGNQSVLPNESARQLFEGYVEILKKVLPPKLGFKNISVVVPEVIICTETGDFPIDAISGGISSIIDLTWQLYMFEDTSRPFVAIIDEPENHLHPELQRTLLSNLIEVFPHVQFIIATHNPLMITSEKDSFVYVLNYNEQKKVYSTQLDYVNRAGTSNAILREVLGVDSSMPIWVEQALENIISKYSQIKLSADMLANLRVELSDIGLAEYIPDSIIQIAEGHNTDDKN